MDSALEKYKGNKCFLFFIFIIIFALSSNAYGERPDSGFANPDFAFPKTVSGIASKVFEESVERADYNTAFLAAIQLDIAELSVSSKKFAEAAGRFEKMAASFPAPYRQLAQSVEARLYAGLYSALRWKIRGRKVNQDSVPTDPMEWDEGLFKKKIMGLLIASLSNPSELRMPITCISDLTISAEDAESAGLTVFDFLTLQAVSLISECNFDSSDLIPFNSVSRQDYPSRVTLIDRALSLKEGSVSWSNAWLEYVRLNISSQRDIASITDGLIARYSNTPWCAPFLACKYGGLNTVDFHSENETEQISENKLRVEADSVVGSYLEKYPHGWNIAMLQPVWSNLKSMDVACQVPSQLLPGKPVKIPVRATGIYDFHLLVVKIAGGDKENVKSDDLLTMPVVADVTVSLDGASPDIIRDSIFIPSLNPGIYALVPSTGTSVSRAIGRNSTRYVDTFRVSALNTVTLRDDAAARTFLYVVSGAEGQPIRNAQVNLKDLNKRSKRSLRLVTDKSGSVTVPPGNWKYSVFYNGSSTTGRIWSNGNKRPGSSKKVWQGAVFPDLSLYKPGDTLAFAAVVACGVPGSLTLKKEFEGTARLVSPDGETVDSLCFTTDRFGRAEARFRIPVTAKRGQWGVHLYDNPLSPVYSSIGAAYVQVADYKLPSFFVKLKKDNSAGSLEFTGKAMTYTGMPVAGGTVEYNVEYIPSWWRGYNTQGSYSGACQCSRDGEFTISLDYNGLKNTPFENGTFKITAIVTDSAGETQNSDRVWFAIGNDTCLQCDLPSIVTPEDAARGFKVSAMNPIGIERNETVLYKVSGNGGDLNGCFTTPLWKPDFGSLPSGKYNVEFTLHPDSADYRIDSVKTVPTSCSSGFVLFRENDPVPPVSSAIWVAEKEYNYLPGKREILLRVGSSYDKTWMLMVVSDSKSMISSKWICLGKGFTDVPCPVQAHCKSDIFVTLHAMHDLEGERIRIILKPEIIENELKIETESFRDKTVPDVREEWKFKIRESGGRGIIEESLPVVAVMTDKSLNSITPFRWNFSLHNRINDSRCVFLNSDNPYMLWVNANGLKPVWPYGKTISGNPEFQTYGRTLYPVSYTVFNAMKSAAPTAGGSSGLMNGMMARGAYANAEFKEESAADDATPASGVDDAGIISEYGSPIPFVFREEGSPVAFFKPGLVTSSGGEVDIIFNMPPNPGTWQFQLLAYDNDLRSSVWVKDVVVQKNLMVALNAPSFLRNGDVASVSATVYSNTENCRSFDGEMEVFSPSDGKVIADMNFSPRGVEIGMPYTYSKEFAVPAGVESICVRVKARSGDFADGEQIEIPVLPESQPVVDSYPFYLPEGCVEWKVDIPSFPVDSINKENVKIEFDYCDNPIWECVTALRKHSHPQSVSSLAQAEALACNAILIALTHKYPQITDASGDHSMPIQKLSGIIDGLASLQCPDGGWSWCPGMPSSTFVTGEILRSCAWLAWNNALPDEMGESLLKGIGFTENNLAEQWQKSGCRDVPYYGIADYLLNRMLLRRCMAIPSIQPSFKALETLTLDWIKKSWEKTMSPEQEDAPLYARVVYALLMNENGQKALARKMMESVLEFSSKSPEGGIWFENIPGGRDGLMPVAFSSFVVNALLDIEPENPAIGGLAQSILFAKQRMAWDKGGVVPFAVSAVARACPVWITNPGCPEIVIDDRIITLEKNPEGRYSMILPDTLSPGSKIMLKKNSESPAWGGLRVSAMQRASAVKANEVDGFCLHRQLVCQSDVKTALGRAVRLNIMINCAQAMDYVEVTIPTCAGLQPSEYLSGFFHTDGVGYYKEITTEEIRLFIPHLPKGSSVFGLDFHADRTGEYAFPAISGVSRLDPVLNVHSSSSVLVTE